MPPAAIAANNPESKFTMKPAKPYLSRKAAIAVAILFSGFLCLLTLAPQSAATRMVMVCILTGVVTLISYQFLQVLVRSAAVLKRARVATQIYKLLEAGRVDEACVVSARGLEKYPGEPLIRINATAAFYRAGQLHEARRIFDALGPGPFAPRLRPLCEFWRDKLKEPENIEPSQAS